MAKKKPTHKSFRPASDAELEILKVLWEVGPGAPADIRQWLGERGTERAYTTVQTLLQRLATKGYAVRRRRAGAPVYEAKLTQEEMLLAHMDDLARRVCGGDASPLVHSLINSKALPPAELDRLREILDEARAPRAKRAALGKRRERHGRRGA